MQIFQNITSGALQTSVTDPREVTRLTMKRGDSATLEWTPVRSLAVATLTGTISEMGFFVKEDFAEASPVLAFCNSLTLDAETGVWSGEISGSEELNTLIGTQSSVKLVGEFTFTSSTMGTVTSKTIEIIVENDVYKGSESVPPPVTSGTPTNESVVISGTITPAISGSLIRAEANVDFAYLWTTDGESTPPVTGTWDRLGYDGTAGEWSLQRYVNNSVTATWIDTTTEKNPTEITLAAATGATGTPVVAWDGDGTAGTVGKIMVVSGFLYIVAETETGKPYWMKAQLSHI